MQPDIRPDDAVGRCGGEEFLILLPGCIGSDTWKKAERLREAICPEHIATPAGILKGTMSIGGLATSNWPEDTANEILQMADSALYRTKGDGGNRTVMAGAAEHQEAHHPCLEPSSHGPQKE
jgi:two-component system, cell cycle response regulator